MRARCKQKVAAEVRGVALERWSAIKVGFELGRRRVRGPIMQDEATLMGLRPGVSRSVDTPIVMPNAGCNETSYDLQVYS